MQPRAGEEIIERISTSADGAAAYLPSLFTSESQAPRRVLSAGAFGEAIAEYARGYHEFVTLFEEALRGDALGEARSA
ncbi:MAG TPA: hypothetical protein VHG28_05735 [Longimicrobiaceae bacterium]|nr:hypothetical protein [Longimicrobiaceae bacterium]